MLDAAQDAVAGRLGWIFEARPGGGAPFLLYLSGTYVPIVLQIAFLWDCRWNSRLDMLEGSANASKW
jgi:hypothetical protein